MKFKFFYSVILLFFLFSCATVNNSVNSSPRNADIYSKAIAAVGAKDYLEAKKYFLQSLKSGYKPVGTNYYLGLIEYKLGNLDKAEQYLKRCIELDNEVTDAHNTLGAIYAEKREYRKAIEEFKKVLADKSYLFPENALYNLALLYYNLGEYDNSILFCKKALTVVPKSPAVYYLVGLNLFKKGLKKECNMIMQNIIKEFPDNVWAEKAKTFILKNGTN